MANRPVYVAKKIAPYVARVDVDFEFHSGFSIQQKVLSIRSLHAAFKKDNPQMNLLEISSKSENPLGVKLSAFNLKIFHEESGKVFSVESAFQGSKVFEGGGPYVDLFDKSSREAKKDDRVRSSGKLTGFKFFDRTFPIEPKTFFYDWLYINALNLNTDLADELVNFDAFTDIEFNPKKSVNCQAQAAAIFVGLSRAGLIRDALSSEKDFREIVYPKSNLKLLFD